MRVLVVGAGFGGIAAAIELRAHGITDVTIVANDTGGAITQLLLTRRPERVARVVFTPCDAFENFLPPAFKPLQWMAKARLLGGSLQAMRIKALRGTPLAYGLLTKRPIPAEVLEGWVRPALTALITQAAPANRRGGVLGVTSSIESFSRILAPVMGGWIIGGRHPTWLGVVGGAFTVAATALALTVKGGAPR